MAEFDDRVDGYEGSERMVCDVVERRRKVGQGCVCRGAGVLKNRRGGVEVAAGAT